MRTRWQSGLATGVVLLGTTALIVLDLADEGVRRWGARHPITVDTVCGMLVVLITVLVVNQVLARRALRDRASAIAAQAAIVLGQAARTVRTARAALNGDAEQEESAREETRSYMTMLLIAAPVLIDAALARAFLEQSQLLARELARVLADLSDDAADRAATSAKLDAAVASLRTAAAPLMAVLTPDQRSAVASDT